MNNDINGDLILGNNSEIEITLDKDINIELNNELPVKKARATRTTRATKPPKPKKVKEIPVSPFKVTDPTYYYGSSPVLVKWKDWLLICNLVKASQTFKELYKEENFKYGDIEESGYVYPVYTKEPVEIKNLDGKVIETIPGIYDEELTLVLPPKFIFGIYRRFLFSQPTLESYIQKIELLPFEGFKYETKFPPRDEQIELGNIAKNALTQRKYLNGIVQCPPGWGKFQFHSDLLATPRGWVYMKDIKVGDEVFSRDGKPTKVTAIYPQGEQDVYQFTFGDNTKTRAGLDHLWKVWDTDNRKWRVLTTKEILSKNYARPEKDKRYGDKSNGMRYKYFIPLCEPVEYTRDISDQSCLKGLSPLEHCFHPYALGLMLGDGSFRPGGNAFGFTDKFRKNTKRLFDSLRENGYIDDLRISDNMDERGINFRSKKLKELTKIYGLDGKYSIEKHIPKEYLYASVESRKLLLEGLIATDGYVRTKSSWEYSTSSPQLKDDVCELARSLGYYVTVKVNENNSYIHNGEKKQTENTNWEICINYKKEMKAITKIEKLDYKEEAQCISVENPEHLYLTNDYIVTHNTYISIHIGSMVGAQVMIVVPNNLLKEQWIEAICEFTDLEEDDIGIIHGSDIAKITKKGHMSKPVVICLIQSLDSQLKRNNPLVLSEFYKNIGMVIYDETHTSGAADGYAKTTGIFTTFNVVGLSATPYKKDKNLFQLYTGIGTIFYISTHQNLIPSCNMHLLPIMISEKDRRNLYDIFEKTNYNYFMSQLEDFLFKDDFYFQYIADWLEYRFKQGYSSVVLFKTNQMLDKLERYIRDKCEKTGLVIKSVILTNATAKTRKHEVSTANIVLSNYKMFSAGADFPHLSCVFFASMVLGKIPIIQTLGRVTRKYADKIQDVQAHFLIPKFIYPLYSNNEPHLTISRAVKLQYPEAQFKWDKGFTDHFQEKKLAAENLVANDYKKFQQNTTGGIPLNGTRNNGSYMIDANYADNNRLGSYIQHQQYQEQGTGEFKRPPSLLPQG